LNSWNRLYPNAVAAAASAEKGGVTKNELYFLRSAEFGVSGRFFCFGGYFADLGYTL